MSSVKDAATNDNQATDALSGTIHEVELAGAQSPPPERSETIHEVEDVVSADTSNVP